MNLLEKIDELLQMKEEIGDDFKKYYWHIGQISINIYTRMSIMVVVYNHYEDRIYENTIVLDRNLPSYNGHSLTTALQEAIDKLEVWIETEHEEAKLDWENR